MDKIISIESLDHDFGFRIETKNRVYTLSMDEYRICHENPGEFATSDGSIISEDSEWFEDYIGAEIISIVTRDEFTDKELELLPEDITSTTDYSYHKTKAQFIDINTNKGTFTLAVYNNQNGYYGHDFYYRVVNKNTKEIIEELTGTL